MWLLFAAASAFFAGITAILAKCGIRQTDSTVATALRTCVVLVMAWVMVPVSGQWSGIQDITDRAMVFLVLSGLCTGASWLCYFKALQIGDINRVVPVDKTSTVLTILLALLFLGEGVTPVKTVAMVLILAGTWLMIEKKSGTSSTSSSKGWFWYAAGSAIFASLTSILGKVGVSDIGSNLGTAIRTSVVLVMAWVMVFVTGKQKEVSKVPRRELGFLGLSGLATGASWLCYYRALQDGPASVVAPVDKLSILVTVAFSAIVFGEKLSRKAALGLALNVAGTLLMLV
ncbi:EamA family transporter [Gemmiger formicilis]|uniref:EamA family transporter n=1 Tax=Gemmiger formicilis TaxID=745368 RepID=UPI0019566868|nr:EamA family transporter [Gemmiger formicilis]MBM6715163.1 EamA family transporter [Gemmiger formicilis]